MKCKGNSLPEGKQFVQTKEQTGGGTGLAFRCKAPVDQVSLLLSSELLDCSHMGLCLVLITDKHMFLSNSLKLENLIQGHKTILYSGDIAEFLMRSVQPARMQFKPAAVWLETLHYSPPQFVGVLEPSPGLCPPRVYKG